MDYKVKTIKYFSLLVGLFFCCAYKEWINPWDFELNMNNRKERELYMLLISNMFSKEIKIEFIQEFCKHNIRYKPLYPDIFRTPKDIISRKYGDCQHKTIVMIGLCYRYLDIKCGYIRGNKKGDDSNHVFMEYGGVFYNSTSIRKIEKNEYRIIGSIIFDDLAIYINADKYKY